MGFSADRILVLDTVSPRPQSPLFWEQVAEHLRDVPGVEKVALAGWPLLTANGWNGFVSVNGAPPGPVLAYFLSASPGWIDTMNIRLIEGATCGPGKHLPGRALVNEAFARAILSRSHARRPERSRRAPTPTASSGWSADAPYRDLRERALPVAYVPFLGVDQRWLCQPLASSGAFIVRTIGAESSRARDSRSVRR